jgi:predicted Zn-dependent protease
MRKATARQSKRHQKSNWGRFMCFGVAIATSVLLILTQLQQVYAGEGAIAPKGQHRAIAQERGKTLLAATELSSSSLPSPQIHPLPTTLAQWQDTTGAGDYFSDIKLTPVGYLVWSQFPVKIYVEQPKDTAASSASVQRFQQWVEAVLLAVREWSVYLPLEIVTQPEGADILIMRDRPPLRASLNRETGKFEIPRARSAETRYEFYLGQSTNTSKEILLQRFTIHLSPHQSSNYTLATARHELGHALGIWGHSPSETDTMYFSQVRNSPQISVRDINTLKRIYQQPTRLGWPLTEKN